MWHHKSEPAPYGEKVIVVEDDGNISLARMTPKGWMACGKIKRPQVRWWVRLLPPPGMLRNWDRFVMAKNDHIGKEKMSSCDGGNVSSRASTSEGDNYKLTPGYMNPGKPKKLRKKKKKYKISFDFAIRGDK